MQLKLQNVIDGLKKLEKGVSPGHFTNVVKDQSHRMPKLDSETSSFASSIFSSFVNLLFGSVRQTISWLPVSFDRTQIYHIVSYRIVTHGNNVLN